MANEKELSLNQRKKELAEQIWLNYFNHVLFEKGIITETTRNKMNLLISGRKSSSSIK